ncbi:MAG TPA: HAD family hydrolase [Jatrophihabitans sp.]|nr:HAD family hydrolase [Jatrophihabitans sp.]
MNQVRLFASDLDGTLLRSDGTVSPATTAALVEAEQAGVATVFVTGRPPRWVHEVADATGHTGLAVLANGAVLYDLHTEQVLATHAIEPDLLVEITETLRREIPAVTFGLEQGLNFGYEPAYLHDWQLIPTQDRVGRPLPTAREAALDELLRCADPTVKLLAKGSGLDPDTFMDQVEALIGDRVTVTRSGHSALVEISALGITKASGLAGLAEQQGIAQAEVAAVGDMPNDVPMLVWAGRSYAVANAHTSAKQAAHTVLTETNDEDAVAHLLTSLL